MAGRRLKVFQAQFGFYDSVIAAPSQAAALAAWGTHQNLFANGDARVTTDAAAVKAALAHPGAVLRRAVGTDGRFEVDPQARPEPPAGSGRGKPKRPPADRSDLTAAERALRDLEANRTAEVESLKAEQDALRARIEQAREDYVQARRDAAAEVSKARALYRKAGGTN